MENDIREQLRLLIKKKDEIEEEILHHRDILQAEQGIGMTGSLLDEEQFPRSDIDLVVVRTSRNKVVCLENDCKEMMKDIEMKLHELHSAIRENSSTSSMEVDDTAVQTSISRIPFACIDQVDQDSPASTAGIEVGDDVIQFGSVSDSNFVSLQTIASVVQHSQGKAIAMTVLRNGKILRLHVTPKPWSGRGLLGCHLVPKKK